MLRQDARASKRPHRGDRARGVDASTVKSIEAGRDRGAALQHRSVHSIEAAHSGALEAFTARGGARPHISIDRSTA